MNNLPQKVNYNLFTKIKLFFTSLFRKKVTSESLYIPDYSISGRKVTFKENLQKDVKKNENKKTILEELENNPKLLFKFSKERLSQIYQLYDEQLKEINIEIQQLENKLKIN